MKRFIGLFIWLWLTAFFVSTHFIGDPWTITLIQAFIVVWIGICLPIFVLIGFGVEGDIVFGQKIIDKIDRLDNEFYMESGKTSQEIERLRELVRKGYLNERFMF